MKIRNKKTGEIREFDCTLINSSKLSAQNRQRLYWCGKRNPDGTYSKVKVQQPEDRGILLRDVLETGVAWREKGYCLAANRGGNCMPHDLVYSKNNYAAEPIRVCNIDGGGQGNRIYSADGKSCAVKAQGGGLGGHGQGLYATPFNCEKEKQSKNIAIYEVRNSIITIKGKTYPIKLADGFYIIRKLTVRECMRLQTVPEWYEFPVSDTQAYKMLGNGWTVDVISHILSYCPGITMEPLDVLSMYDGMACGYLALDNLGAHISRYRAMEIDKYAIKTACHNFPGIEQLGDAFQVRESSFC